MIVFRRAVLAAAALSTAALLGGCGPHGPKGDRGLAPAPEGVAYPDLNRTPPDGGRQLRSREDQKRLQAEILARKPQRR